MFTAMQTYKQSAATYFHALPGSTPPRSKSLCCTAASPALLVISDYCFASASYQCCSEISSLPFGPLNRFGLFICLHQMDICSYDLRIHCEQLTHLSFSMVFLFFSVHLLISLETGLFFVGINFVPDQSILSLHTNALKGYPINKF